MKQFRAHVLLTTALTELELRTPNSDPSFHLHIAREMMSLSLDELTRRLEKDGKSAIAAHLFEAAAHLCVAGDKILGGQNVRSR